MNKVPGDVFIRYERLFALKDLWSLSQCCRAMHTFFKKLFFREFKRRFYLSIERNGLPLDLLRRLPVSVAAYCGVVVLQVLFDENWDKEDYTYVHIHCNKFPDTFTSLFANNNLWRKHLGLLSLDWHCQQGRWNQWGAVPSSYGTNGDVKIFTTPGTINYSNGLSVEGRKARLAVYGHPFPIKEASECFAREPFHAKRTWFDGHTLCIEDPQLTMNKESRRRLKKGTARPAKPFENKCTQNGFKVLEYYPLI